MTVVKRNFSIFYINVCSFGPDLSVKFFLTDVYCHDTLTVLEQLVQLGGEVYMVGVLSMLLVGIVLIMALILFVILLTRR